MDPWIEGETDLGEQFHVELLAAYGPDWPTRFPRALRFDPHSEPLELALPEGEPVVVRKIFLRLPLSIDEEFKQVGRHDDRSPSELASIWITERLEDR